MKTKSDIKSMIHKAFKDCIDKNLKPFKMKKFFIQELEGEEEVLFDEIIEDYKEKGLISINKHSDLILEDNNRLNELLN